MTRKIDLNADMGESYGAWTLGNDAALLDIVTSANIACGLHAGDWDVMAATMAAAVSRGVRLGCHPGFPDIQGFGRRRMQMPTASLQNLIRYQLGAAQAMARAAGGAISHLKLHGALANMASEDVDLARACYSAALDIAPDLEVFVLVGTAQQTAAEALGCRWAGEIFADRAYNTDATLVDRALPGAVIHDAAQAAESIVAMLAANGVISRDGTVIPARIDTICVHGDTAGALAIAKAVRRAVARAGYEM